MLLHSLPPKTQNKIQTFPFVHTRKHVCFCSCQHCVFLLHQALGFQFTFKSSVHQEHHMQTVRTGCCNLCGSGSSWNPRAPINPKHLRFKMCDIRSYLLLFSVAILHDVLNVCCWRVSSDEYIRKVFRLSLCLKQTSFPDLSVAESREFSNRSSTVLNNAQQEELTKNLMALKHTVWLLNQPVASLQLTCQKLTYVPTFLLLQIVWVSASSPTENNMFLHNVRLLFEVNTESLLEYIWLLDLHFSIQS